MFNFSFDLTDLQNELVNQYKKEYQLGWVSQDTIKGYLTQGIIDKDEYHEIVDDKDVKATQGNQM